MLIRMFRYLRVIRIVPVWRAPHAHCDCWPAVRVDLIRHAGRHKPLPHTGAHCPLTSAPFDTRLDMPSHFF